MTEQVDNPGNFSGDDSESTVLMNAGAFGEKKLIGITGGIGSGKSTVSRYWAMHYGLPLINIDSICAQLLEKGKPGWLQLRKHLDDDFFDSKGCLDRRFLRLSIFSDQDLRLEVNSLIHPLAYSEMCIIAGREKGRVVLVDVPLLFEAGWENVFTSRVVVYAGYCVCCRRIMQRDSISIEEAEATVRVQVPLAEKALRADHVINNSGSVVSTLLEVAHLARLVLSHNQAQVFC